MSLYNTLVEKLTSAQNIAASLDQEWERRIGDLVFEVSRISASDDLETEWNPYFKLHVAPDHANFLKDKPEMNVVFGYRDEDSPAPDTISFEDMASGFCRTKPFDPQTTDLKEFIQTFAEEAFAFT